MSQICKLIVVTLMPPNGETGVQTHFNSILKQATKQGIETALISPYNSNVVIIRKIAGLVSKTIKIFNLEYLILLNRWTHYSLLKYQLKRHLLYEKRKVVIYTQDPLSSKAALMVKKPGQQVVTVIHFNISEADEILKKGMIVEGSQLYRQLNTIEANILPQLNKIIFVSGFMQKIVNERLSSLKSVPQTVLSNYLHDKENRDHKLKRQGDLITIGTLETRKNQKFILNVLAKAHARGYLYNLTIIGNGPDRTMLEKLAHELNISDYVNFLGFQPKADEYMKGHRVYVHAALMENLPITLLEALSNSLPILAPAVGGIPEIFFDGQQGYFWPLDDPDLATDKLCEILENNVLHAKLSEQAHIRFENNFSEQVLGEQWLKEIINC